jgi:Cdc6-like AAA superfamily ATPase
VKIKITLKDEENSFSTYDANDLRAILQDRAKKALSEDSYSDSAIAKSAAVISRNTGNAPL